MSPEQLADIIRFFETSAIATIASAGAQATGLFPFYSMLRGIVNFASFHTSRKEGAPKYSSLLSGLTLWGTTAAWGYEKWMMGTSSFYLIFVGLAIQEGIELGVALDKLRSESSKADSIENNRLRMTAVIKFLRFSAFIALALGNPAIGCILLSIAVLAAMVPMWNPQSFLHPQQQAADSPAPNDPQDSLVGDTILPGFKAFSGTGHRLGGN
jgi:hypothetical protein